MVPHFGQAIGSLLRSKNFAPQFWHWRLVPSSGLAIFSAADRNWPLGFEGVVDRISVL
jgi:hypothetical protein